MLKVVDSAIVSREIANGEDQDTYFVVSDDLVRGLHNEGGPVDAKAPVVMPEIVCRYPRNPSDEERRVAKMHGIFSHSPNTRSKAAIRAAHPGVNLEIVDHPEDGLILRKI